MSENPDVMSTSVDEYNDWKQQYYTAIEVDGEMFYVREGIRHTEEQLQSDWKLVNREVPKPGEDPILDLALAAWIGAFASKIQPLPVELLNDEELQKRRGHFHKSLIYYGHTEEDADRLADIAIATFVSFIMEHNE